jgi:hypothetical protein
MVSSGLRSGRALEFLHERIDESRPFLPSRTRLRVEGAVEAFLFAVRHVHVQAVMREGSSVRSSTL